MDIPVSNEEIKKQVINKMTENGSLGRINEKFKIGLIIAMDEIQTKNKDDSIDYGPFKNAPSNEKKALQYVLQFLSKNGFAFTLSCLIDEANNDIDKDLGELDIKSILPEGGLVKKTKPSEHIEPPKVITKNEFNKLAVIMSIDEL